MTPLEFVLAQIDNARQELDNYPPENFGWYDRSIETANLLIPWLGEIAPSLKTTVENVARSKDTARDLWSQIKSAADHIPEDLSRRLDEELEREAKLLVTLSGESISNIIGEHLIDNYTNGVLEYNGRSDYPDLFLRSKDYQGLPKFKRSSEDAHKYGAALKGKQRPVRVPDGLEIKTCKERFAVDSHHAHAGLHLVLIYSTESVTTVTDILVAFLSESDYRITKPRTKTTTLKASFTGKNFVSLLHDSELVPVVGT